MNKYAKESRAVSVGVEEMRYNACVGKEKFPNQQKASSDKNQTAYKCEFCDYWHRSGGISKIRGIMKHGRRYLTWSAKERNKKKLKALNQPDIV